MPIIKRYPNRKLYDTAAKQYISLDVIADLIRKGEPVQVTDYATGEDVTALILVQIIAEQEKQHSGFLPRAVLTGLIQTGGNTLTALRRGLSAPLDLIKQVDEEIQARIEKLVSLGELAEDEGRRLLQKLLGAGKIPEAGSGAGPEPVETQVERAIAARGLPTREDMDQLRQVIERLTEEVDSLRRGEDG